MRTPEEIIGADAVAALEAEGYQIEPPEPLPSLRTSWTDTDGVEHAVEYTDIPYSVWRDLNSGRV